MNHTTHISQYLSRIATKYKTGIAREHAYRSDMENLLRSLLPDLSITNEPADVTDCGNPDFVLTKGRIPIGYIEAKDIGKDLNSKSYREQFDRYRAALDNLMITDYGWFQYDELYLEKKIADADFSGDIYALLRPAIDYDQDQAFEMIDDLLISKM